MSTRGQDEALQAPSDERLRREVRARLTDRRLPLLDGVSKSHRGTGRPCIVCRRPIEAAAVEREVTGIDVVLIAHELCYKIWREESEAHRKGAEIG